MKKHIYIYSPSGAVRDKAAFKRGIARLKTLGHEVEVDADALSSHLRFAGDDPTRLAAVQRAIEGDAEESDAALMDRGGFTKALKIVDRWTPDFPGSQRLQRLRAKIVKARDSQ